MSITDWDKVSGDYQRLFVRGSNDYNKTLLRFLKNEGMIKPGCRVIDIGCGVGKYGTYFAQMGCDVTLTDISPAMLGYAEKNMAAYGSPWRTLQCDFNTVRTDAPEFAEGFDLAISTFSPAIHDFSTVKKMSAICRGWCFVTQFIGWEQPLRDRFYSKLGYPPAENAAANGSVHVDEIVQAISENGYTPHVKNVDYGWLDERSPREAAEYLLRRHKSITDLTPELIDEGEKIAAGFSDERGIFMDAVNTKVLWIYWKAKEG